MYTFKIEIDKINLMLIKTVQLFSITACYNFWEKMMINNLELSSVYFLILQKAISKMSFRIQFKMIKLRVMRNNPQQRVVMEARSIDVT